MESAKLIEAFWSHMVKVKSGSGNDSFAWRRQAFPWTNMDVLSIGYIETRFSKNQAIEIRSTTEDRSNVVHSTHLLNTELCLGRATKPCIVWKMLVTSQI